MIRHLISKHQIVFGCLLLLCFNCVLANTNEDGSKNELVERLLDLLEEKKEVVGSATSDDQDLTRRQSGGNECSGRPVTLTNEVGTIQSPGYSSGYPNLAICMWRIVSQKTNAKIRLTFKRPFSIEEGNNCAYDYVEIYDGSNPRANKLGIYCGSKLPAEVITTGNTAFILFKSDYSVSEAGFSLKYEVKGPGGCDGQVKQLTGNGSLNSPNFPQKYSNNLSCKWRIQVPSAKRVKLIFEAFDVEDEIGCPYDNLTVYDGTNASAHQLGNYCGTRVPKDIITSSNIVFIVFKSDDSVIGKGFKINFKAVNPPTKPPGGGNVDTTNTTMGAQIDLDCDFEQGNMCLWSRATGGNINWKLRRASQNTYLISNGGKWGDKDHTTGTSTGRYILIDGGETARAGSRGYLMSPELTPGPSDGRCLQLWYNMYYTKGLLQVVMRREDENDEVIWQRNGDQGNGWHKGRISLISNTPYRLVLVGSRGTTEKETGIAVDDIVFDETPCATVALNCGESRQKRSLLDQLLKPQRRILGGETSSKGMWPWIVAIRTIPPGVSGVLACGGSLIHRRWVLTAAHCFEHNGDWITNPTNIDLHLGEHNVGQDNWDDSQIVVKPEAVFIHPQRERKSIGQVAPYDVALLKLPHDVTLNEDVNVVCLPLANDTWRKGTTCSVSGWGRTETVAEGSDKLMHVELDLMLNRICSSFFGMRITNDLICAKHGVQRKASCKGDSGGPLVCSKDGRYILLGVVSWGVPCSQQDQPLPTVFSSVTYYLPWIQSTMNSEE